MSETVRPRIGWPWCGDVTTVLHDDGTIALAWDNPDATCTIVGRSLLDGIVDERNRLTAETQRLRGLLGEVAMLMPCESPGIDRFGDVAAPASCGECVPCRVRREAGLV